MEYENINVNSENYKLLSNEDKLKVLRAKINTLIEEGKKEKHPYTFSYNGVKYNVSKEKSGIFKDLIAREKKLKKLTEGYAKYTLKDNNIKRSPLVDVRFDSDIYKNMTIEEKIAVVEAKYNFISNLKTFKGKPFDSTKKCNELKEMLNELKEQKQVKDKYMNIEINSDEYNKLDTREKIKVVETKLFDLTVKPINEIRNDKKIYTVSYNYNDKILIIPCSKITSATKLIKLLKELEKKLIEEEKNKKTLKNRLLAIPIVAKIINKRKDKKNKGDKKTLKEKIMSSKLISKIKKKKEDKKNKKSKKTLKSRFLAIPIIAKIINKRKDKKNKGDKKTLKERYNNSTFGKAMKKKKNRVITALCAYALIIASFTSCFGFKSSKNINNNKANVQKPTTSQVNNEIETEKTEDIIIEEPTNTTTKDENNLEKPSNNNNNACYNNNTNNKDNSIIEESISNDYSLGDTVTIEENARIYTNSYDATYNTNSYNPYYNGGYERTIEAVVYELNGYVYTIFNFDTEANTKIEELEKKGAKLTAVLVNRNDISYTNNYEGFYDIDSVKVRTKTR